MSLAPSDMKAHKSIGSQPWEVYNASPRIDTSDSTMGSSDERAREPRFGIVCNKADVVELRQLDEKSKL